VILSPETGLHLQEFGNPVVTSKIVCGRILETDRMRYSVEQNGHVVVIIWQAATDHHVSKTDSLAIVLLLRRSHEDIQNSTTGPYIYFDPIQLSLDDLRRCVMGYRRSEMSKR